MGIREQEDHHLVLNAKFQVKVPQGASQGGSEKPGKLEVGGASRDSTGLGALEGASSPVEAGTAGYL